MVLLTALCTGACQPKVTPAAPTAAPSATPTAAPLPLSNGDASHAINPLTGLPAVDPYLLKTPAVLISISNFPAYARPQAGLSYAPFVYEFYITEGATRFLAVFYGEFPAVKLPVQGGCETRTAPFIQTDTLLGNLVWYDANGNGLQDPGEGGISGLCVNLFDQIGDLLHQTATDSNGYYGFNVHPGHYTLEFVKPPQLALTALDAGDDALDSDANPANGGVEVTVQTDRLNVDAGFVAAPGASQALPTEVNQPAPQVGPIRSGRLIYRHIAHYFQNSCLIFGGASPEVLGRLPKCLTVFHELGGGGFMLDLSKLQAVAKQNKRDQGSAIDYSGNLYANDPPEQGAPASKLNVFIAYQNQSAWLYDPLYRAYVRYVDTSMYKEAGILHPDTDRLTSRQLHFENIVVLFAQHQVISPTNLDIHLDAGKTGKAILFRDGQKFNIDWSTVAARGDDGIVRPIQFLEKNGQPVALRLGHTWVLVVTPDTTVENKRADVWQLTFVPPPRAK